MSRTSSSKHWDMIYGKYAPQELGWYTPSLATSLKWIQKYAPSTSLPIIDIGGGSSTLVDELIGLEFTNLTVLDLSQRALDEVEHRLGPDASRISFSCCDVRDPTCGLPDVYIWHDRAAFHFLKDSEIHQYKTRLLKSLLPGGTFILGVFSENAPPTCSGLPVNRHSLDSLGSVFEDNFSLLESHTEVHRTPGGVEQEYLYTAWMRIPDGLTLQL